MQIRHILLATDLTPAALRPCLPVAALARAHQARVTLFNVVREPQLVGMAPLMMSVDVPACVRDADKVLAGQRELLGPGVEVASMAVSGDSVHTAVNEFVREHGVDLIALSTAGRTGFQRFALGSVAEDILRHSEVPVLLFPRGA